MKKRMKHIVPICILFGMLLFVAISYGRVEYLTIKHGDEFLGEFRQIGMIDSIDYLRIFNYADDTATVYYSLGNHGGGIMVYFSKSADRWILNHWEAVWSTSGSAGNFIWPYYR